MPFNFNFDGTAGHQTRPDPGAVARVRQWVRTAFNFASGTSGELTDGVTIMVTELQCAEEGCPPVETVIAVLDSPGNPRQFKIHKPIAEVTEQDVSCLVTGRGEDVDHQH